MWSKALTGALVCALLLAAQAAHAEHDDWRGKKKHHRHHGPTYDYARVIDVEPIVRHVRVSLPRRECYVETHYERIDYPPAGASHRGAAGSMIVGGLIGAAVGNQIGSGDGRRAATVAGAIIGSAIGHDVADRRVARTAAYGGYSERRPYEVERCDVRYEDSFEERIDGYRVTYLYGGRRYVTHVPYDPGGRIRVRVDVRPEVDY